jgi:signal transduction histidine kinase
VLVMIALSIGVLLVRRWLAASRPRRRIIAPVLWTGAVIVALRSGLLLLDVANAPAAARQALIWLTSFAISAVPFAFLAGLLRSSYSRADVVGDLIARLHVATSSIRDAIAAALRDPSLELIYWRTQAGRYVTADGRPAQLPSDVSGRGFIEIEREGQRMAAIIFDAMLAEEPKLVAAVSAAGALALDNERLQAELRARITELEQSRARVLDATLRERQRIERDLHDGAQQRFVSVAMELGVLDRRLTPLPEQRELLRSAREQLESGIAELRELARGIHPALLTGRGLGPAVETLAERVPLDVRVVGIPDQRLPTQVEVAAYFIVSESLTNAVRHAHAARATVRVGRENGTAIVEVADDGVGGADPARGSGLRGLIDRLAALDGELVVHSPVGDGTRVEARIPCA